MTKPSQTSEIDPELAAILRLGDRRGLPIPARLRGPWGVGLALIAVVALVLLAVLRFGPRSPDELRFVLDEARRDDLTVVVTATGSVQPTDEVDVSSELSGIVRSVFVDYNSIVKVGQKLAELDTDKLEATVQDSRARLAAAEAAIEEAEATIVEQKLAYDRARALVERNVSSERDLDVARAAYDRAVAALASTRAQAESARAELKLNETNLSKACICSPIDGIVLKRQVEPGQTVASSLQAPVLFVLAQDLKSMEVQVDVDEADVGLVREGQPASFTVDAYPDRPFEAKIKELRFGSEVVQGVVTYKAVLSADNEALLLRPGMTATAEITVEQLANVLTVPNEALRFTPPASAPQDDRGFLQRLLPGRPPFRPPSQRDSGGPQRTIWVLRDGLPEAVAIRIGATDGRRTQVVAGPLEEGAKVIVDAVRSSG